MIDPLAVFEPSARDPFDLRKAGHLLRRAGFGGSLRQRRRLVAMGVDAAVAQVCRTTPRGAAAHDELLQHVVAFGDIKRVRAYRVLRALECQEPLRERMSMFWHDHFATSNDKLRDPRAMAIQAQTFDRLGLATFDELCRAMVRDPALLRWLDNDTNLDGSPNENFAREWFELFTLGIGAYGEADVREAARAFTGYQVHAGNFRFVGAQHDSGSKTVLGHSGALDGEDIVRLSTEHEASGRFLAERWLRFFVHPQPDPAHIEALAARYRSSGRDIGATLRTLLRSRLFFSDDAYRTRIQVTGGLSDRLRSRTQCDGCADRDGSSDGAARRELARATFGRRLGRRTCLADRDDLAVAQQHGCRSAGVAHGQDAATAASHDACRSRTQDHGAPRTDPAA